MRKKSNTRSYFFEISQPSRICAVASPVFYFTFILYLFGEGVAPTKNAGSTLGTVQEKKSFPPHAGGLSAAPRSPVLLRRIFARRDKKRLPPLREPESGAALKRRNAALTGIRRVLPLVIILLYFLN